MSELFDTLREALADRYALERELGRGGMATVFLAEDLKHGRQVAIKVLHPEIGAAIGPERFQREIEIAARLQHPHILPLYDSGAAAGYLFYVMPFVEGESLRDRLNREHQLAQEEVTKITAEVASALGYAHTRGIVHRDIKPENIMLSGGTAVVTDFGIARAASAAEQQQLTQTGTVVGTPAYMSPEQGTGDPNIDGRSDQYSLACVVYEMLVGQPPFTGPNVQAIIARHSIDMVSPPSIVRDTIPDVMEDALLRALAKVPADRFPTIILFADALARPSAITGGMRRRTGMTGAAPARRLLPWRRTALVAGALLGAAVVTRLLWHRGASGEAAVDPRRIAVLYFEDRSPDHSLGYLADGVTEALIHELADVSVLNVISRNGVAPYKGRSVAPDSIARALKVGTIVDGKIEPYRGDSLRLSVEMVNPANGDVIGSSEVKASRADVFALQDTLASQVSVFLRLRLGREVQQLTSRAGTRNGVAWGLVQQAQELSRQVDTLLAAGDTAAASGRLLRADTLLDSASRMDRKWITPIVERGWIAVATRRIAGLNRVVGADWIERGQQDAAQALEQKPDDPRALELRGTLRFFRWILNLDPAPMTSDQLLEAAERDLRAGAVATNPDRARANYYLAALLMRKSETADAKLAAQAAYDADPYLTQADDVLWRLFQTSLDLEDGVEAGRWCREGYRRFPMEPVFSECQIELYALPNAKPDIPHAWKLLAQNVNLYPPNLREYRRRRGEFLVAMAIARAGLTDSADAVARRARADDDPAIDPTHEFPYLEMLLRVLMGDMDGAIDRLKVYLAYNHQDRSTIAADHTWWLRDLRKDPRFGQIVGTAN